MEEIKNTTADVKNALQNSEDEQKKADQSIKNVSDAFKMVNENLQKVYYLKKYINV